MQLYLQSKLLIFTSKLFNHQDYLQLDSPHNLVIVYHDQLGGFLSPWAFLLPVNHIQSPPHTDYQQPCPLITIHPSTAGELNQSHFNSNWPANKTSLKMFQLQVGVLSCQGDFTLDIWAAKWAVGACSRRSLAFWGNRDTHFHEGGTRLPQPKAELKGQAQRKKGTIDTLVFFSQRGSPVPNVFSGDERRRGGGLRDRTGKQIQRGPVSMPWLCDWR